MSLDYDLYTGEGLSEKDLLHHIRHRPGFALEGREFSGPGVTGAVFEAGATRNAILEEGLGVRMEWCAGMRVDLSALDERKSYVGIDTAAKLALFVVKQGSFDALLLFNGESPCLLRRAGTLRLSRSFWTAMGRLSFVDEPHVLEELPSF